MPEFIVPIVGGILLALVAEAKARASKGFSQKHPHRAALAAGQREEEQK